MKTRLFSPSVWVVTLLLWAILALGVPDGQAQRPGRVWEAEACQAFCLREGQPLPGAGYPWQRVSRPAPAAWAPTQPPAGIDLDVTYINRAPTYRAYCVDYPGGIPTLCPGTEAEQRWPAPGEVVTLTAHVVNKGTVASPAFAYRWTIDGAEVLSGVQPALAPGAETTVTCPWTWAHALDGERLLGEHTVGFSVDPGGLIAETYEINNRLEDRTDALGFRFAITPEMVQAYDVPWNPAFSYSAEDWLQRQVAAMNWALAGSIYPITPGGASERVRIDDVVVTASPPPWDRASDGGWFVDADYRIYSGGYDPATDVDWSLVHELSHQVGLIDLYNYNIAAASVYVLDREGGAVNLGFSWPRPDLMGGGDIAPHSDPHLYSSHSAGGISATEGYRRGYYGEYQFDIPEQNYLLVLDNQGNPAGDVQVDLYQRSGPPNWVGELGMDNVPEISGTTGPDGRLLLANRPAGGGVTTHTSHTLRDNPFGVVDVVGNRNRFLLKLGKGAHEEFAWLDLTAFNLAYWQGDTASHTFAIASHVPPPAAPAEPAGAAARVEGEGATLCWQASPSPDVAGYQVYRAAPPTYAYEQVSGQLAGLCYTESYGATRLYAVTAVDGAGRESGFSNFAWAPRLVNPYAVGLTSDGLRTILDPQNGYALLRQRADGRYLQNFGSPHYHLEYSHFLVMDGQDRLILSHPGDEYSGRHSVRVADREASPLLEFGERGSGPGQFQTPAGVATLGQPASIEGPYPVDAHTLLLLHFDGSYDGAQGEPGTPGGTAFTAGRYGQGVLFDDGDTLTYGTAGNLERTQGAIEFWLRPNWDGDDGQSYTFFEVGDEWFNRMRILKDGADNLRFLVWDSSQEYGVAHHVAHWLAGEWHHVAVTWQGTEIALFVDGQQRDNSHTARPPDLLAGTMAVGSSHWADQQAEAVIDEFRISDVPRVGHSDGPPYRFLVVDRDNHRLQAFDELGNFLSAYGSHGSGPGQFDSPQGLAVDGTGRVIVADTDNDRLQALSFDGYTFGFLEGFSADLNRPAGVAACGPSRILVADTGNDQVKVLDAGGALLATYTGPGGGDAGPFHGPQGVVADPNGDVVVADTGNRRVVSLPGVDFRASPTSGIAPLTVTLTNVSCRSYAESLWDLGDGQTSTLDSPTHVYTATGVYTVSLTVSGPGGSATAAKPTLIRVWPGQRLHLPLVSRGYPWPFPGCQELITNGGFEDESAWIVGSTPRPARYTAEQAHSGSRSMLLGLKPGEADLRAYSSVRQAVSLPASAGRVTLSFWTYPLSGLDDGDRQECLLLDEDNKPLAILMRTNLNTAAWTQATFDLTAYAGRTVQVYLNAYNDGDGEGLTGFYLDDVSVWACAED